jgi:hypothetical protein
MDDRPLRVESAVQDLVRSIGDIERRLAVIERAIATSSIGDAERQAPPAPPPCLLRAWPLARDDLVRTLSFIGRTFVALVVRFSFAP